MPLRSSRDGLAVAAVPRDIEDVAHTDRLPTRDRHGDVVEHRVVVADTWEVVVPIFVQGH